MAKRNLPHFASLNRTVTLWKVKIALTWSLLFMTTFLFPVSFLYAFCLIKLQIDLMFPLLHEHPSRRAQPPHLLFFWLWTAESHISIPWLEQNQGLVLPFFPQPSLIFLFETSFSSGWISLEPIYTLWGILVLRNRPHSLSLWPCLPPPHSWALNTDHWSLSIPGVSILPLPALRSCQVHHKIGLVVFIPVKVPWAGQKHHIITPHWRQL